MDAFFDLAIWTKVAIAFTFGIVIGSFLNVFIYRFHTGKSLRGSSHCMSCGTGLKPYELFPLISYVCLIGKCRTCGSRIPARYFLVEFITGILFVAAALISVNAFSLFLLLFVFSALVVIAVYDLYHLIIPDEFVGFLLSLALIGQAYQLIQTGFSVVYFYNIGGALLGAVFFYGLWHYSTGRWIGFGDVKLAIPLGLMLGYAGVFSMIVLSFWIGTIASVFILAYQNFVVYRKPHLRLLPKKITMKSAVPFAPFLILGFLTVLLFEVNVVDLLSYGY